MLQRHASMLRNMDGLAAILRAAWRSAGRMPGEDQAGLPMALDPARPLDLPGPPAGRRFLQRRLRYHAALLAKARQPASDVGVLRNVTGNPTAFLIPGSGTRPGQTSQAIARTKQAMRCWVLMGQRGPFSERVGGQAARLPPRMSGPPPVCAGKVRSDMVRKKPLRTAAMQQCPNRC